MNKKRKLNKGRLLLLIFLVLFGILFIVSLIKIISYLQDNKENKSIKKKLEEVITIKENTNEETNIKIDFNALKMQNPDTVAYLKVNGTNIDYIVVKGNDNSYYLKHNFNKNWNVSGWIFADYHNSLDGFDKNIVIYGHNTKDGSMFGTLKKVLELNWQQKKDNRLVLLVTENNIYHYEVFSTYTIEAEDYYINTEFASNEEFSLFINKLKSRSNYNFGVELNENDKILTLSSCSGDGRKRVVMHVKRINN